MKIVTTTLGDFLGDFFPMTLNLGYLTGLFITAGFFLLALMIQLSSTLTNLFIIGWLLFPQPHWDYQLYLTVA
jgi:uncharacterized membrane-anchored protein